MFCVRLESQSDQSKDVQVSGLGSLETSESSDFIDLCNQDSEVCTAYNCAL